MRTIETSLLIALLAAFASCRTHYELLIRVADEGTLNPSDVATVNPVEVQFFHLKSAGRFKEATFKDLWYDEDAEKALSDTWDRSEATPRVTLRELGQIQKVLIRVVEGVQFIGVFARYSTPADGDTVMLAIPCDELERGEVVLQGTAIRVRNY